MGFFEKIFGNKSNAPSAPSNFTPYHGAQQASGVASLNLNKEESLKQLNLRKEKISSLCLEKNELNGLTARVCLVLDFSGSMEPLYLNGKVQQLIERLLPIAMQFDDNGEMECWLFSNDYHRISDISLDNYYNYIKNENLLNDYYMGGTNYSPVMKDVVRKYSVEEPMDIPTLVLFITDGDNFDKSETTREMIQASRHPIFWQFVGIGNSEFTYLEQLDEMEGRYVDNANFFPATDLDRISDDELYHRLLNEYPEWIQKARNLKMIP